MLTVTYYKFGSRWFIDAPEYIDQGGDPDDLERIGAFHDLLEMVAAGESTVTFHMDIHPFEGADVAEFTGMAGANSGGYYYVHTVNGQPAELELWFNTFLFYTPEEIPARIYFKKLDL